MQNPHPPYCCPRCHGPLESNPNNYTCPTCPAVYPIIAGIPDFRLYPDPYISLEADRAKGQAWGLQTIESFHTHGTPPVPHLETD